MQIELHWEKAIHLPRRHSEDAVREVLEQLNDDSGIYVFGRVYNGKFHALYVGKATTLCSRLKTQLNSMKLWNHLQDARKGQRVLLHAVLQKHAKVDLKKALDIAERAVIRHFVASGADLLNKNLVEIRIHSIDSYGAKDKAIPKSLLLEAR